MLHASCHSTFSLFSQHSFQRASDIERCSYRTISHCFDSPGTFSLGHVYMCRFPFSLFFRGEVGKSNAGVYKAFKSIPSFFTTLIYTYNHRSHLHLRSYTMPGNQESEGGDASEISGDDKKSNVDIWSGGSSTVAASSAATTSTAGAKNKNWHNPCKGLL